MYKVISGRFETGNEKEQMGYKQLFGEDNIQYKSKIYLGVGKVEFNFSLHTAETSA